MNEPISKPATRRRQTGHTVNRRPKVTVNITIDKERELYVILTAGGFSCLGFDVLNRRTSEVADWLHEHSRKGPEALRVSPELSPDLRGTLQAYGIYLETMRQGETFHRETGNRCNADLTPQLIGMEGKRVEVVDRHEETRRFWVGKSTGWFPVHLEIARRNSSGGGAVTGAPFQSVRIIRHS